MNWHRLFGLVLKDYFAGSPFVVEIELDLSAKKQMLDIVILRKGKGEFAGPLPDGLHDLTTHNLITFKSHRQPLDDWAIKELIGHYVNYRKQVSPSLDDLLPEEEFRLYAVCARFPQNLARAVELEETQPGVFACRWGTDWIRIVVASGVPEEDHNANLLFSAQPERVRFGATHYRQRSPDTSTLITTLFDHYQVEGVPVPYTMEDFRRDFVKEHLHELTLEERLKGVSIEERLKGVSPEELRRAVPLAELLKGISVDELARLLTSEELKPLLNALRRSEEEPPE